MKRTVIAVALLALAGCATTVKPADAVAALDTDSPKYTSPECVQAREAAAAWEENTGARLARGVALGLLGPIGIAIAAGVDSDKIMKRKAVSDAVVAACS